MSEVNMNVTLQQLQAMAAAAQSGSNTAVTNVSSSEQSTDFSALLKQSIGEVNGLAKNSGKMQEAFQLGDPNVDIAQVMIAMQKSSVAFEAMTQVRNKLVSAYKDIMSMPV